MNDVIVLKWRSTMTEDEFIELIWGDGAHKFALTMNGLRELQEKTGSGPLALALRLSDSTWKIDDIRETVRLGLIGGGKTPAESTDLVRKYVDARPIAENLPAATAIIGFALFGRKVEDAAE
jgi:hypothetical protein